MLTAQRIREFCLAKEGALETYPFGQIPICYKVNGRIFCELYGAEEPLKLTLRCAPPLAEILREQYSPDIVRGYHCPPVQQKFKNTVTCNRSVSDAEVYSMIDHSYGECKAKQKKNGVT